jgi:hypothetical protein
LVIVGLDGYNFGDEFMDANPCVRAMLWFDAKNGNEPDFRLESDSASLNAMRNWLKK